MKKVKITVLKTTLDKELAEEYGAEGLTACPMLKGRAGILCRLRETGWFLRRSVESGCINMHLLWRTAREMKCFITATGSASRG